MILLLCALFFGFVYLGIQFCLWLAWLQIPILQAQINNSFHPFSIVIAARNEYENLSRLIPDLLGLDYPHFELIIAVNQTQDQTITLLQNISLLDKRIKFIDIPETPPDWSPKKWALAQGIGLAQYEWLVFTDADCSVPPKWLHRINAAIQYKPGAQIVMGMGIYASQKGLLNSFVQFETFYAYFQYIGWAVLGLPYMAVGRNLAYTRSFFEKSKGFEEIKSRLSGDDDLLVNKYATKRQISFMIDPESITVSSPPQTFPQWSSQKKRHVSASAAYSLKTQTVLGLFHLSHLFFYLCLPGAIITGADTFSIFMLYWVRLGLSFLLFQQVFNKVQRKTLFFTFPLLDLLFVLYNLLIVPLGLIQKPEWK